MSNIIKAEITIRGVRAILWCHFGPEAIPQEKVERTGVAGNDPEEWHRTVLMTKERQLYLEPSYIFGAFRDGARHTKKGRGSIQPALTATLQVVEERILLDRFIPEEPVPTDSDAPVYIDIRGVRNPTTKAWNVWYRCAAAPGWGTTFNLIWDKTVVNRAQMEAVAIDAGKLVGLSNGRSIGFGRFEVIGFEVSDFAPAPAS